MSNLQNDDAREGDEYGQQTEILYQVMILPSMPSADDTIRLPRRGEAQASRLPSLPQQKASLPNERKEQSARQTVLAPSTGAGKRDRFPGIRHSPIPGLVGTFFVVIQLLLLARFGLKVIGMSADKFWVGDIYELSYIFIWPFRMLLQWIVARIPISTEVYTLLAILLYGFLSRVLVRFLKALLNSR